jgi:hypothetical protein
MLCTAKGDVTIAEWSASEPTARVVVRGLRNTKSA